MRRCTCCCPDRRSPDRRDRHHPWYPWLVGAPITWGSLVGSYLLWGRWSEPSWQRRAGLLVLMNGFDLLTWFLHNAEALGLPSDPQLQRLLTEHAWFLTSLTRALAGPSWRSSPAWRPTC
jgi:hypothetical protein